MRALVGVLGVVLVLSMLIEIFVSFLLPRRGASTPTRSERGCGPPMASSTSTSCTSGR